MRRRLLLPGAAAAALLLAPAAEADAPGTDGGPAQRACKPVRGGDTYVGATNVRCRTARRVARRGANTGRAKGWRCHVGTGGAPHAFGHCHGTGSRRGAKVHWAVND